MLPTSKSAGIAAVVTALCAVVLVAPREAAAQMDVGRVNITIATATPTGNYFATGNAVCRLIQRQGLYLASGDVTLLGCGATATTGSVQNVDLLRAKANDFALIQSDWVHYAINGLGRFTGRKSEQLRSLFSLNQEAFQVLAGRSTGVENWVDLAGKKVNLGPVGTTSNTMFQELLALHGKDQTWFTQALTLPITQHVTELCDGNVEVIGQTSGVPNGGLRGATAQCGAQLVSLDTEQIRGFVAARPFYTSIKIPKGTYQNMPSDVTTFGVLATMMTNADTPEHVAYSLVRAVFEGLDDLKDMLPALRGIKPAGMIKDGLAAPLHPGAQRYYRERGWIEVPRRDATAAAPLLPPMPVAAETKHAALPALSPGLLVEPASAASPSTQVRRPSVVPTAARASLKSRAKFKTR